MQEKDAFLNYRRRRIGGRLREPVKKNAEKFAFHNSIWDNNRIKLTVEERACFIRIETFDVKTYRIDVRYVLAEPWRYVLKVVPNMVTHTKLMDADIESELSYIDDHIDNHNLAPRINLLTRGRGYHWNGWYYERAKYINKFKNIPRYSPKEAYLKLEI